MARIARVAKLVRTVAIVTWRDVRSLGSLAGQNFLFCFATGAGFFALLLLVVLLFPLSTDPMEKIPEDRRASWPVERWEWAVVRFAAILLSPVAWVAMVLFATAGWRVGALMLAGGVVFYGIKQLAETVSGRLGFYRLPAFGGLTGSIMRLQLRTMLHTLDPYLALALVAATEIYRLFASKPLDPAAPKILSLLVAMAVSTEGQVLFSIDGRGAERFRLMPIRGWRILLAKDLAFLVIVGALAAPLDFMSGFFGGMAAVAVGHHNSVFKTVKQTRWRFTRGVLFPPGALQTVALLGVGMFARTEVVRVAVPCVLAWLGSVILYGWLWDRRYS